MNKGVVDKCPLCKFDYSKLKASVSLVKCPDCGKSYADISEELIRILF